MAKTHLGRCECCGYEVYIEDFAGHDKPRKFAKVPGRGDVLHARIVMEKKLGRELDGYNEAVHHINGDCLDDRPENLKVVTRRQHAIEGQNTYIDPPVEDELSTRQAATILGISPNAILQAVHRKKIPAIRRKTVHNGDQWFIKRDDLALYCMAISMLNILQQKAKMQPVEEGVPL